MNAEEVNERILEIEAKNGIDRKFWDALAVRLEKAEAAVAVYDRLGVELVAQLKALKIRVDALENEKGTTTIK